MTRRRPRAVITVCSTSAPREHSPSAASLPSAHPALPRAPPSALASFHELPAVAGATEELHSIPGVRHAQPGKKTVRREEVKPDIHFP